MQELPIALVATEHLTDYHAVTLVRSLKETQCLLLVKVGDKQSSLIRARVEEQTTRKGDKIAQIQPYLGMQPLLGVGDPLLVSYVMVHIKW